MSIATEKLLLPRRDVRKKKLPRCCHDGFQKRFQIFLLRLYLTRNIGTRSMSSKKTLPLPRRREHLW
jgi:hypothetical protein